MKNLAAWTLSQLANATNIVAGIVIAHALSPTEFGRFATMAASLTIMCSILNPLMNELAHFVSKSGTIHMDSLRKRTLASLIACVAIAVFTCRTISHGVLDALVLYVALPITLLASTWVIGILIGLHRMRLVGAVQLVSAGTKVALLGVGLLYLPSLAMVSWAYALSFIVTVVLALAIVGRVPAEHDRDADIQWGIVAGLFLLALPFSLDQAFVQAWYPAISGDYAAVMTYAKSVVLIAAPALTIAYSSAIKRSAEAIRLADFAKLVAIFAAGAAPLATLFWLLHPFLFPLLLGSQYAHVMGSVGIALLAMTLHVVAFSVIQVFVIRARWIGIVALAIPVAIQATLLKTLETPTVASLVSIGAWTFLVQLFLALAMLWIPTRRRAQP